MHEVLVPEGCSLNNSHLTTMPSNGRLGNQLAEYIGFYLLASIATGKDVFIDEKVSGWEDKLLTGQLARDQDQKIVEMSSETG